MRVAIWASSDTERDPERKPRWGDYWLKLRLEQELERQGWTVDEKPVDQTDVFIHCFGGHQLSNIPAHAYNVLYIHSHPGRLDEFDFGMYDRVVAGSEKLAGILNERGIKVYDTMVGPLVTCQEMTGVSFSFTRLDDELKKLWDMPCESVCYSKMEGPGS